MSSFSSSSWKDEALAKMKERNDVTERFEGVYRDYAHVSNDNLALVAKMLDLERYTLDFQCEVREIASKTENSVVEAQYVHQRIRGMQDLIKRREGLLFYMNTLISPTLKVIIYSLLPFLFTIHHPCMQTHSSNYSKE